MTTLPKKPGPTPGSRYTKGLAPCQKCQRTTRSAHMDKAEHPGTIVRKGRGLCATCHSLVMLEERSTLTELRYPILQCTADGCEVMTRSTMEKAELAPGTRRRVSKGRCSECYKTARVRPERVQAAKTELDAFLAARRARAARQQRRVGVAA